MPSDIISLTEFKGNAADWVEKLQSQPPIVLTQNGKGRAVVQSYEGYRHGQFQLALLRRMLEAERDAREGRLVPHEQVMAEVREMLGPNVGVKKTPRRQQQAKRG